MSDFKPMLAAPADFKLLEYPLYASPKLDGIRAVVLGGRVVTRKLLDVPNRFVREQLSRLAYEGLDGELILGNPTDHDVYRRTNSAVMSHDGEPEFTLYTFDDHTIKSAPFYHRLDTVRRRTELFGPRIVAHEHKRIEDEAQLLAYEAEQVAAGYEGLILRKFEGAYKYGRSTAREQGMLKVKRFEDSEAMVIGVVEEMFNGNEAEKDNLGRTKRSKAKAGLVGKGTMGALQVRDTKTAVEFELGTGFTAADRADAWPLGTVVKYKFFPVGVKDKPRHPVYLGRRHPADMS